MSGASFFARRSIRQKQVLLIMLACSVALVLACAAFMAHEAFSFRREIVGRATGLAEVVGNNTAVAIDFFDPASAVETLSALRGDEHIVRARVFTDDGIEFAEYLRADVRPLPEFDGDLSPRHEFVAGHLRMLQPIRVADEQVGTIELVVSLDELADRMWRYAGIATLVLVAALVVALVLSASLQRFIANPILHLADVARSVARDRNYSLRARKTTEDEIGQLMEGFNEMLGQIELRDEALQTARDTLERRVAERTAELAASVSLLNATLDSTADGILALDREGRVACFNRHFATMWGLPAGIVQARDTSAMIAHCTAQAVDPDGYKQRIRQALEQPETETSGVVELKDGRVFERYSRPQFVGDRCVGHVLNFRDVTERRRAEAEVAYERDLLRALLDACPDSIYFKDRESRLLRYSASLARALQCTTTESLLGKTDRELFDPALGEATRADELEIMRTGQPIINKTERAVRDNGDVIWTLTSKVPLRNPHGEIIGTMGISKDITPLKEAEARLAHEQELLRALLDSCPDDIYFKDRASRFLRTSNAHARRLGVATLEAMIGKSDADFFAPEHAMAALHDEQEIMRTGEPLIGRLERETWPDGRTTWALTSKMPLRDVRGEIVGTFGISKDVTAIKYAEEKLESVHKELLQASRMAGMAEVATGVLHNVGNVLNSVNVSATLASEHVRGSQAVHLGRVCDLLQSRAGDLGEFFTRDPKGRQIPGFLRQLADRLAEEQREVLNELETLRKNVEHIKEIVALQQNYTKVSGLAETVAVTELVEDALRMNAGALDRHEVRVVREYATQRPITIERHKALQILVNLIRNAKYACEENSRDNRLLTLRITGDDQRARLEVIDNGIGIAAENLTRIFSHGFTTRASGHGFGLHSGALAARELGGTLSAHSDGLGCGARFVLEVPWNREAVA